MGMQIVHLLAGVCLLRGVRQFGQVGGAQPSATVTAGAQLHAWQIAEELSDLLVLALPLPLEYLVSVRGWTKILCRAVWHRGISLHNLGRAGALDKQQCQQ